MYTVFDAATSLAIAQIAANDEAAARSIFSSTFTGYLGRRLIFVHSDGVSPLNSVAYPLGIHHTQSSARALVRGLGIAYAANSSVPSF